MRGSRLGLVVLLVAVLPGGPARAVADQDPVTTAIADQLRADHVPVASWAVVRDGEVDTDARGDGVDASTPFVLGSISKSFTALAVLQLVDAGRVELDAPVSRYLPQFRTVDPGVVVTVWQLLTQTSGLPTAAGLTIVDHPGQTLGERVRAAAEVEPVSAPGATFHYSNLNYAVLGRLVEEASGASFADYLQRNVFDPLGMTGSTATGRAGVPSASTVWFGVTVPRSTPEQPGGAPDGFVVSTAADVGTYLRFQLGDGTWNGAPVLSETSLRLLHTAATPTGPDVVALHTDAYGMGWGIGEIAGQPLLAHDGDVVGYHANVALLPDSGSGLVVLTARNGTLTDANGPAGAGLSVLAGEAPTGPSRTFLVTYVVVDAVAALLVVFFVRSLRGRRSGRRRVLLNLLAAAAVPVGVFVGLATATVGFPVSLRFAFGFVGPDVTVLVLLTSACFLTRAVVAAVRTVRAAGR